MTPKDVPQCQIETILALNECLTVLGGKWKVPIIGSLQFGSQRFKDLELMINITPRMLSKELKELELNNIIRRNVDSTTPSRIAYELTESGKSLSPILEAMVSWGVNHRKVTLNKT